VFPSDKVGRCRQAKQLAVTNGPVGGDFDGPWHHQRVHYSWLALSISDDSAVFVPDSSPLLSDIVVSCIALSRV